MKSVRGWIGIGLFVVAVVAMPFGYWTDSRWYVVAAFLGVCGLLLMRRGPRSLGDDLPPGPPNREASPVREYSADMPGKTIPMLMSDALGVRLNSVVGLLNFQIQPDFGGR